MKDEMDKRTLYGNAEFTEKIEVYKVEEVIKPRGTTKIMKRKMLNRPIASTPVPIIYVIVLAWLALFEQHISHAAAQQVQDPDSSVSELINELSKDDVIEMNNARESLRKKGAVVLNDLKIAAETANRTHQSRIVRLCADIVIDMGMNPEKDTFLLTALKSDYYETKQAVLGTLASRGHMEFALNEAKKISEPSADDDKVFDELINVIRVSRAYYKIYNPTMNEEAYLGLMGKKINSKIEKILSEESETRKVKYKLLTVYRNINQRNSNDFFLKLLSESKSEEFKKDILSELNTALNKKDMELVEKLRNLKDKETGDTREDYERVIKDLTDGWKR